VKSHIVELSGTELVGEVAFHDTFFRIFGFLEGYGRNMDAWIDCMSYLRASDRHMTTLQIGASETLTLLIRDHVALRDRAPKQWLDLIECCAFVNRRAIDRDEGPILALAF
jgi:RNAse (barnase) inhibitor barstar